MWNWNSSLNVEMNINKNLVDNFKKYAKISGTIFILLGLAGIIYPAFMSLTTLAFVSYLMIFAGIMAGWMTWTSNKNDWAGWLKSVLLVMVGLFMLFYPLQGVAAIGLLFAVYFLMDAFAGFGLAFSLKPQKIWWLWLINAITSLVLGILFIWGWPLSSLWLVGLFVGISLLFDGIALLTGGMWLDEIEKKEN